uniref:Acetylcholinesterase n=1 Tax=Strongyloides papillosus TaxID=174720 RepID=A0A0N5B5L9_STREA
IKHPSVTEFLGIPFAQPPVGILRFKAPKPLKKNYYGKKCFKATTLANTCYFNRESTGFKGIDDWQPQSLKMSEDCLQLNMWVPTNKTGAVIIFINGKSYRMGSPSLKFYDGNMLASFNGTIVVNINYRHGVLGFAYMLGGYLVPGNMGLLDQQMAIKWVYDNIESFGGNKSMITLFGHGTGSSSATAHMFSEGSKPYFSRIVAASGTILNKWAIEYNKENVDENFRRLMRRLRCFTRNELNLLRCMQRQRVLKLVIEADKIFNLKQTIIKYPFLPIDGDNLFFNGFIVKMLRYGFFKKDLDIVIGKIYDEASVFMPLYFSKKNYGFNLNLNKSMNSQANKCNIDSRQYENIVRLIARDQQLHRDAVDEIIFYYSGLKELNYRDKAIRIVSDFGFDCDFARFARKIGRYITGNKYLYEFEIRSTQTPFPFWMGLVHGYELLYFFGHPFTNSLEYKKEDLMYEKYFSFHAMEMLSMFVNKGKLHDNWLQYSNKFMCMAIFDANYKINNKFQIRYANTKECLNVKSIYQYYRIRALRRYRSDYPANKNDPE